MKVEMKQTNTVSVVVSGAASETRFDKLLMVNGDTHVQTLGDNSCELPFERLQIGSLIKIFE